MYALHEAKQQILTELKKAVGREFTPDIGDLTVPPNPDMGDASFPCFGLAKGLKRPPTEIASEIAAKIGPKGFIRSVDAAGPYVNFTFDPSALGSAVLAQIKEKGEAYGTAEEPRGVRVLIEYANPNTHKDIHVGHLRNFFLGQSLTNLLSANGYETVPVSYINDLGAHVAACLWGIKHLHQGELPPKGEDPVTFMGRMYAAATAKMAEDPAAKQEVSALHRELEAGTGPYRALWKKTRQWSLAAMKAVFKELRLPLETFYYESDLIGETKAIVEQLIKRGLALHSQGAWIVDLETEGLGVNLLVKSDGTLLYNAKDLALAMRKEQDFRAQRSLYVVDGRQSLAMSQLFATLRKMGKTEELTHVSYEFVTLKEGAMSSRKGTIIRYEFFRDEMIAHAREETAERHPDWAPKDVDAAARKIAFAAIRFGMLKQDPDRKIVFDMDEALSFDGCTGPYLLYSLARIASVLRKAGRAKPSFAAAHLSALPERRLLIFLASYPEAVFDAAAQMRPSLLAQYLFDLAKRFAEFYAEVPILSDEGAEIVAQRLGLCAATGQVLKNGLALLGMETVKEM